MGIATRAVIIIHGHQRQSIAMHELHIRYAKIVLYPAIGSCMVWVLVRCLNQLGAE